jgi:hypothetical protein
MKLIGDQIQVFLTSSAGPPRHFGSKGQKESKFNTFWKLNSDCKIVPNCAGHNDFIRDSDWDVIALFGKLIKSIFQRI